MFLWRTKKKAKARKPAEPDSGFITVGSERVAFTVQRSRKRKRTIAFRMERDASLRILAPNATSLSYLTRFLQSRAAWVAERLAERAQDIAAPDFTDGSPFIYLGHLYRLRVTQGFEAPQSCLLSPRVLHVHVPDANLSPESLREEVRLEILLWLRKRARAKFKKRLDLWAQRMDVDYKKLLVTDPQRRWGSCSVDNIIRLNWRLMMAPLPILDYVVAHELAHIPHKNHGARFWNFLEQFMPDYQRRRDCLRRIERTLTL